MEEKINVLLFCEKQEELLSKILLVFTRKKLKINHFGVDFCEDTLLYKINICYWDYPSNSNNMIALLERIIEVFRCYSHLQIEEVDHQILLFKIPVFQKEKLTHYPISYLFQEKDQWICCGKIPLAHFHSLQNTLTQSKVPFN